MPPTVRHASRAPRFNQGPSFLDPASPGSPRGHPPPIMRYHVEREFHRRNMLAEARNS